MVNKMSVLRCMLPGLAAAIAVVLADASASAQSRYIVTNPVTGFAADSFDPVAYFADGKAREGSPELEATWEGVAWRFANAGNRAAFLDHPEVYAPAFGGHCAVAVARGYMAAGKPTIWEIHEGRLYFFHSQANRRVFLMDPDSIAFRAGTVWAEHTGR